jgi:lysophospholipase L1-like esterase
MSRVSRSWAVRGLVAMAALSAAVVTLAPGVSQAAKPKLPQYYLSLGDSYSVGYQPGTGATPGYTAVVAGKKLILENFGCGGATSSSILTFPEDQCGQPNTYGPPAATNVGPSSGTQTQVDAAVAFIESHPANEIHLITVSIGGNDITACAAAVDPTTCVASAMTTVQANVTTLVGDLYGALVSVDGATAAATVPIVGITYPDVFLGLYVNSGPGGSPPDTPTYPPSASNVSLAQLSQEAFSLLINPGLTTAYTSVPDGKFANVTQATGGFTSLSTTGKVKVTGLPKAVTVPKAVVSICKLTYFCTQGNIHANTKGYKLIGKVIKKAEK